MDINSYNSAEEAHERLDLLEVDYNASKSLILSLQTLLEQAQTKILELETILSQVTPFDQNILNDYAKKVQTINTDTIYIDTSTGISYKMYIVKNAIAVEEISNPTAGQTEPII